MFTKQNDETVLSWIKSKDLNLLGRYLVSGTVHGKPGVPASELDRVEKLIKKNLSQDEQYALGKKLLTRTEYAARNIGTHLIPAGWPSHKDVEQNLRKAANDDDWIVREYAAETFASLLRSDFSHFSKVYLKWVRSESANVKRAIALAVKYDSQTMDSKKWQTYFDLIDPLMAEEHEYIRKNLGPFTIGDGLLKRYPKQILSACKTWIKSDNENVRWNTAMIFTSAAAREFTKQGMPILKALLKDEKKFVSNAAKKALKNPEKSKS